LIVFDQEQAVLENIFAQGYKKGFKELLFWDAELKKGSSLKRAKLKL